MTQEEKQLLLKDLCARLPYGVKIVYVLKDEIIKPALKLTQIDYAFEVEEIRPYLRPMSSMTEEEQKEFNEFCVIDEEAWHGNGIKGYINQAEIMEMGINWLNAHHFDYRGLIEKGLALEATELMYDTKTK